MVSFVGDVAGPVTGSYLPNPIMRTYDAPAILERLYWRRDKAAMIRAAVKKYLILEKFFLESKKIINTSLLALLQKCKSRHRISTMWTFMRLAFARKDFLLDNCKLYMPNKLFSQVIPKITYRIFIYPMFNYPLLFSTWLMILRANVN